MTDDLHFEPFLHLAGLTDDQALIAWGGFYFRRTPSGRWRVVQDDQLSEIDPGRRHTIGLSSQSYGPAVVEVLDAGGGLVARYEELERNHVWIRHLEPDTLYRYRISVNGQPWATGERWDWDAGENGHGDLVRGDNTYEMSFRTHPDPARPAPVRFAVLGDYGIGLHVETSGRRQAQVADALRRAVEYAGVRLVLTVGDNIYEGAKETIHGTGDEDSDWYLSFYQPYRYVIDHVPVYPSVGNHDDADTELSDDREQLADNHFTALRFDEQVEADRVSVEPGLFYRFHFGQAVEFICIDSSLANEHEVEHYFALEDHRDFLDETFDPTRTDRGRWLIPFGHHPPYCAGPDHYNNHALLRHLVPRYQQAGVRLVLAGHEHNYQHSIADGIHYFISGAGGKLRTEQPDALDAALTRSWAAENHFLLVDVDGERCEVTAVRDVSPDGSVEPITVNERDGSRRPGRVVVS